jgi:hypothetical protein
MLNLGMQDGFDDRDFLFSRSEIENFVGFGLLLLSENSEEFLLLFG